MKISEVIEEHGNLEVIMEATTMGVSYDEKERRATALDDVFRSTVGTLRVTKHPFMGQCIQLYWQCE